jgi:hypothetical protein
VAVAHICGLRCVGFGKHQMANNAEPGLFHAAIKRSTRFQP